MSDFQLERECRAYARYLVRDSPSPYLMGKYIEFHRQFPEVMRAAGFDGYLIRFSSGGSLPARLADSYAARFFKGAVVRKKLVLMLALMECSPGTFEILDDPPARGFVLAASALCLDASVFIISLMAAILYLSPVRLWMAVRPA